jgi:hypothetical protein
MAERQTTRCDECGHEIEFGEFPFCPHGKVDNHFHTVFVPYVDHFISQEPGGTLVTSHHQRMKLLKANNLDFKDRTGKPGCEV